VSSLSLYSKLQQGLPHKQQQVEVRMKARSMIRASHFLIVWRLRLKNPNHDKIYRRSEKWMHPHLDQLLQAINRDIFSKDIGIVREIIIGIDIIISSSKVDKDIIRGDSNNNRLRLRVMDIRGEVIDGLRGDEMNMANAFIFDILLLQSVNCKSQRLEGQSLAAAQDILLSTRNAKPATPRNKSFANHHEKRAL